MINTFALAALLALPAQDDVWKDLKLGDRVQVSFRSGSRITGVLVAKPGDPKVKVADIDYSKASELTLDVTLEFPGLNGSLSVSKKEIKEVRKLEKLDPATLQRLQDELRKVQQAAAADEVARKAAEQRRDQEAQAALESRKDPNTAADPGRAAAAGDLDPDRLKKGLELLARFPPPEWGPERVQDITAKAIRKQPITLHEKEFADNIGLWTEALNHRKSQEKKDGKTPETPSKQQ
jgi:DNA-directed RNA polymerase subunit F